ncbi:MAG: hypothetical protein BWZ07_02394 [Alphaproteobacteria bacterium ADurb.BinA280]|nr:MAG: hypothetical protein BWZ07_02394 [Alphaproteobacteria bacterium ADurb.BinA280]
MIKADQFGTQTPLQAAPSGRPQGVESHLGYLAKRRCCVVDQRVNQLEVAQQCAGRPSLATPENTRAALDQRGGNAGQRITEVFEVTVVRYPVKVCTHLPMGVKLPKVVITERAAVTLTNVIIG